MRKWIMMLAVAVMVGLGSTGWAADAKTPEYGARIDISGVKREIELTPGEAEGGTIKHASWLKAKGQDKFHLWTHLPVVKEEWREKSFSFTAETPGRVTLMILGQWLKPKGAAKPMTIVIDTCSLTIEGATLNNADFSKTKEDGTLSGWWGKGKLAEDKGPDGEPVLRTSTNDSMAQNLTLTAGQLVTITFKARLVKAED